MRFSIIAIVVALALVAMVIAAPKVLQANRGDKDQQATAGKIGWQYDTGG